MNERRLLSCQLDGVGDQLGPWRIVVVVLPTSPGTQTTHCFSLHSRCLLLLHELLAAAVAATARCGKEKQVRLSNQRVFL